MRVSKRAFKKALLEANDRETRLLVRKPHIFGDGSGLVGLFFGAGGQHFWNREGEPHDNARASLACAQNEMTTTHLMTHFLSVCLSFYITISRKLHSSQMHDFMTIRICGSRDMAKSLVHHIQVGFNKRLNA